MAQFKPLLPWPTRESTRTLIGYQLDQLARCDMSTVVVVLGNRAADLRPHVERDSVIAIVNQDYEAGKAGSVRLGIAALPESLDAIVVLGVDQPRPAWFLQALIAGHLEARLPVSVPTFDGRWGHPPMFRATVRAELLAVREGTQGLRAVVRGHYPHVAEISIDSPLALLNINEPRDYEEGLRLIATDAQRDARRQAESL
jgi:molybdenum cofactor cytidylyltransferase